MRLLLRLLPLILLSSAAAEGGRTLRILFLAAPEKAPETLHLFDGTGSQKVELPRLNLSPVYELAAGTTTLHLLPAAPAAPEEVDPGAPKVAIPEGVTDFYLLVSSDLRNAVVPVKMQIIDASVEKFKPGQMLWYNLTPNRVGGRVGSAQLAIGAHSRVILDPPASRSEDFQVNLSYRMPDNERLYPLCETKWLHDPRSRTILFILPQAGNRTPRILGIPDYREKAEAPAETQSPAATPTP